VTPSEIVPPARPNASRADVLALATADGLALPPFPFLVAQRGYYGDTMGKPGQNDVNIYDDAMWLVEREGMVAFNANCDPSRTERGIARLCVGRWKYRPGIHNVSKDPKEHPHYEALVQAGHVTVDRGAGELDTGFLGINIHCGGNTTTSSLGCQTIPPAQWGAKEGGADINRFMGLVHRALAREGRDHDEGMANVITYVLTSRYSSP
jgi:hypothetical protein